MNVTNVARSTLAVLVALAFLPAPARSAEPGFRTDINPALLYYQAYQQMPELSESDQKHLFEYSGGAWPDQPFDERALDLIRDYDNSFKLLHRARFSRARTDSPVCTALKSCAELRGRCGAHWFSEDQITY